MKLRTLEWNIGGGKSVDDSGKDVLDEIIEVFKNEAPDIITLQETHANESLIQAEQIANSLGYEYWFNDIYDDSHIEKDQKLGQAIISKYPTSNHSFSLFPNPKFELKRPNGDVWLTHDKGISTCTANLENREVTIQTLHLIPFVMFGIDALGESTKVIRNAVADSISQSGLLLLQGDFNFDGPSVEPLVESAFQRGILEVSKDKSTIAKNKELLGGSRILYRGLRFQGSKIIESVPTDSYPIVADFHLE